MHLQHTRLHVTRDKTKKQRNEPYRVGECGTRPWLVELWKQSVVAVVVCRKLVVVCKVCGGIFLCGVCVMCL